MNNINQERPPIAANLSESFTSPTKQEESQVKSLLNRLSPAARLLPPSQRLRDSARKLATNYHCDMPTLEIDFS